jgi:hypothetical protein
MKTKPRRFVVASDNHGDMATYVWLRAERKAGRVKMITGTESRDGKIVNTSRYVLGDG